MHSANKQQQRTVNLSLKLLHNYVPAAVLGVRRSKEIRSKNIKARHNPKEQEEVDEIITSSYDDFIRLERRNLLLVSSLILISCVTGIVPASGNIFGFEFTNLSASIFYSILCVLDIYFILAFSIYSYPLLRNARKGKERIIKESGTLMYERHRWSLELPNFISDARYGLWLFIHFILPIFFGIVACIVSLIKIA